MERNLKLPTKTLEPMILNYCWQNPSFFLKVKPYLETDNKKSYFSDIKYQEVFNYYSKFYDKYDKPPKKASLLSLIDRKYEDEELREYYKSIVNKMYKEDESYDSEYIEDEIKNFVQENRVYEAWFQGQENVENGDYGALLSKFEEAVRINFDKDLGTSIKDVDTIYDDITELMEEDVIDTGYSNLNSILDGGFHNRELYVLAGLPGGFKTGFLGNFAVNAFLEGKKALVYTFETSRERLAMRYYANVLSMDKKEMLMDEAGFKKKSKEFLTDMEGDIIVKEYNANSVCSNDLMAHIQDLKRYKQWEPDIIIVDYILIMLTNDKRMSAENSYKYYKTVSEEVRNIGKTYNVPILSGAQLNREAMSDRGGSKAFVTARDISESRGIYDTCDFLAIINQTAKEKEKNKYNLYIDKSRNDRTGMKIEFNVNYEHMTLEEGAIF